MSRRRTAALVVLAVVVPTMASAAGGATVAAVPEATLAAPNVATNDAFGASVSVSGDTAAIGAPRDGGQGAVHVFVRADRAWTHQAKLVAGDGAAEDRFGGVAASGDTVLVGATGDDDAGLESGAAYVFVRAGGTWTQQAKLVPADAAAVDFFGTSVALSGDTAVVGAPGDDDAGTDSGSAYVFVRTGGVWTQQTKLVAADGAAGDGFGLSVSVSGDTAVIGAPYAGENSGSAYVFVRSGGLWTQQTRLVAADNAAGDLYGWSVAVDGDTATVGARAGAFRAGAAYVFVETAGSWSQQAKLAGADTVASDWFGYSVSLSGDIAVVGAPYDADGASGAGSAYVFARSEGIWTEQAELIPADGVDDFLGWDVALSADTAVVGSPAELGPGSAYVYRLVPDGDGDGIPDAEDPDTVAAVVSALPDSAFSSGEHARPFLNKLDEIEAMIAAGDLDGARTELQNLRRKVDGCGATADSNDWVVDCAAQREVRALIDELLAHLGP